MRLRPYKSIDSQSIIQWIQDEDTFIKWGGEHFGSFPIDAKIIDDKYCLDNGDCIETDNFFPWVLMDENKVVGHFIMRYTHGDNKQLRFGWVIVDPSIRNKGYGKEMLKLGLQFAFDIYKVNRVTIGVFENNTSAYWCYKKVGFHDTEMVESNPWNIQEMEILKEDYYK